MNSLAIEIIVPPAVKVEVDDESLSVELSDGRTITVPLNWYPRLKHATSKERENWRLIGGGAGVHWEDVDEDISVEAIIAGRSSSESQESLKKWLQSRHGG